MLLRSRRFCHGRPRGAPHEIDDTQRVGRLRVAAPGDIVPLCGRDPAQRSQGCPGCTGWNPPRSIANDAIRRHSPIGLIGPNRSFSARTEIAIDGARIGRRILGRIGFQTFLQC